MKELQDLKKGGPKYFRDVVVDEQNIFQWTGLLVPEAYPYNKGSLATNFIFNEPCPDKNLFNEALLCLVKNYSQDLQPFWD